MTELPSDTQTTLQNWQGDTLMSTRLCIRFVSLSVLLLLSCKESTRAPSGVPSATSSTSVQSPNPVNSAASPITTPSATAPTPAPTNKRPLPGNPSGTACAVDSDCVVTNFPGCCACPQCSKAPPRALPASSLAAQQAQCQTVACSLNICSLAGMCPPGEDASKFLAHCRANVCVLERR
jgi:hypothetical protein